ncbi:MAG: HEAT repeat domain-containing protein [Myxococcales bacterium]|nr:HEAT repeat domain-containing protein [Myxococcales bacterium]
MIRKAFFAALVLLCACNKEPELDGRPVSEWISLLRHDDWSVQGQAISVLVRLDSAAVPFLVEALQSRDPSVRRGAVTALGRIGPHAAPARDPLLRRIAREEVAPIRARILEALSAIDPGAAEVRQEFNKRLRDREEEVREAARRALESLEPPKKPEAAAARAAAGEEALLLRQAAAAELEKLAPGTAFGVVAEVAREDRRAVIVWPAIRDQKILDDDLVAFVFSRQGDGPWTLQAGNLLMSGKDGPARLAEALGGADKQRLIRPCGVPRAELSAHLRTQGCAFRDALRAGEAAQAVQAYEKLTRAFSFPLAAYSDFLPELLSKGGFCETVYEVDSGCAGATCRVEMRSGEQVKASQVVLQACGGGEVIAEFQKLQ